MMMMLVTTVMMLMMVMTMMMMILMMTMMMTISEMDYIDANVLIIMQIQ